MASPKRHDPFPVNPTYAGIYAHGVEIPSNARTLLVSGQIGVAPDGALSTHFDGQFEQAIENLKAVLKTAGMTENDVVKMTIFLVRPEDIAKAIAIRKRYFDGVRPAITTVIVSELVSVEWLVEIEATAARIENEPFEIPRGRWV